MPIPCEQKDTILEINRELKELTMKISTQEAMGTFSHEQIVEIFGSLKQIKTYVDQNAVEANHRDEKLDEIKRMMEETKEVFSEVEKGAASYRLRIEAKVEKIQSTVENGLNKRVDELAKMINQMSACLEERKKRGLQKQDELESRTGWTKFFTLISYSFDDFVRKYSALSIVIFIMGIFFFVLWFVTKADIFGEKPVKGIFQILFGG